MIIKLTLTHVLEIIVACLDPRVSKSVNRELVNRGLGADPRILDVSMALYIQLLYSTVS